MAVGRKWNISKIFLICINVVFLLLGLGFLIIGALIKSGLLPIKDGKKTVLNSVKVGDVDFGNLADNLWILFIVVGVLISVVSFLGLCGACNQNKALLTIYAVLVLALLVTKIAGIVLWFIMKDDIESDFKAQLVQNLHTNFVNDSISDGNDISNEWNMMFMSLDCCAVNNVTSTTNDFDKTPWCTTSGECQQTNAEIPKACCVGVTETNYTSAPTSCFYSLNPRTYNTNGCYLTLKDLLKETITSETPKILGVGITILLVEILGILSAANVIWKVVRLKS
ncbi:CD63 antigen-like isoform X2 [Saccostrea echinata]|uniref:CD63 antigen-like isoform X2 n=1 Tax=Saccostrea echinata TaxID=191078 RepID=UPI002A83C371|nr:CD63 antigen-like isoform X2 [Saccostrea echinata]